MGNTEEKSAFGQRGFLIRSGIDDQIFFRVYDQQHNFIDYEIINYDCEVVIIDRDAAFIRNDSGDFLDYTTESMSVTK